MNPFNYFWVSSCCGERIACWRCPWGSVLTGGDSLFFFCLNESSMWCIGAPFPLYWNLPRRIFFSVATESISGSFRLLMPVAVSTLIFAKLSDGEELSQLCGGLNWGEMATEWLSWCFPSSSHSIPKSESDGGFHDRHMAFVSILPPASYSTYSCCGQRPMIQLEQYEFQVQQKALWVKQHVS